MRRPIALAGSILIIVIAAGLAGCGEFDEPVIDHGPLPDRSLHHLDASWTSQDEDVMQLADFRGRPTVMALIYAHCAYACPMLVHDMKAVASELGDRNVQYVLVSLDPERDTPEQLRTLKEGFGLDDQWTLLRGDLRDVRRLAALVGVQYRTEDDGEISHSNIISVLDRDGEMTHQQEGLGLNPVRTADILRDLLAAR